MNNDSYPKLNAADARLIGDLEDQCDFAMSEVERRGRERDMARDMVHGLRKQRAIARKFGEQMERERDEAREAAAKWESSSDAMERAGAEQARRADENREWAVRLERERDEAILELGAIQATIAEALNLPRTALTAADVHAALNHLTQ